MTDQSQITDPVLDTLKSDLDRVQRGGKIHARWIVERALKAPEWSAGRCVAEDILAIDRENQAGRTAKNTLVKIQRERSAKRKSADLKAAKRSAEKAEHEHLMKTRPHYRASYEKIQREMNDGRVPGMVGTKLVYGSVVGTYHLGRFAAIGLLLCLAPVALLGSAFGWGHAPILGIGSRR